jgi:hypothetical protein
MRKISLLCGATLFLIGGLVWGILGPPVTRFTCHRTGEAIDCERHQRALGVPIRGREVHNLHTVRLATRDTPNDPPTYRVEVEAADGTLPVTPYWSSDQRKHQALYTRLSEWRKGTEAHITLTDTSYFATLFSMGVFAIGLMFFREWRSSL